MEAEKRPAIQKECAGKNCPWCKLLALEALLRKHNHPGVNVGAHKLASECLAIIEGRG